MKTILILLSLMAPLSFANASSITVNSCVVKEDSYYKPSVYSPSNVYQENRGSLAVEMKSNGNGQSYSGSEPLVVRYSNVSNASVYLDMQILPRSVVLSARVLSTDSTPAKVIMSAKTEAHVNTFGYNASIPVSLNLENPMAESLKLGRQEGEDLIKNPGMPTDTEFHAGLEIQCSVSYNN